MLLGPYIWETQPDDWHMLYNCSGNPACTVNRTGSNVSKDYYQSDPVGVW